MIPHKIFLADDSAVMLKAMLRVFEDQPEVQIIGQSSDFQETMRLARELEPDVLVMDLHMAQYAEDAAKALKHDFKSLRIIAISLAKNDEIAALAERVGADRFVDKMELYEKLIPAILEVSRPSARLVPKMI